jgi:hypothetical protein
MSISLIIIWFIALIPILLWGYLFSYIDNSPINRFRFFSGILAWWVSVFPILYMDKIIAYFWNLNLNIFENIANINNLSSSLNFFISLNSFLLIIWILVLLISLIFFYKNVTSSFKIYLKNILFIIIFSVIISSIIFILFNIFNFIPNLNFEISSWVNFWETAFNSFKLVLFYYLLVGIIEEVSKHFNFIESSFIYIKDTKSAVLYAIFIALWFWFVENILYLSNIYNSSNSITSSLIWTFFFRSIFSVFVHVTCSTIVAYYFAQWLQKYNIKKLNSVFLKLFLTGLMFSVIMHAIFDISLTLGFSFIIFIYFIFGYLYITWIFYKNKSED